MKDMKDMKIKYQDHEIDVTVIDHQAKITLLCVHGFGSNKEFIKTFGVNDANFNVVAYSVPIIEEMSVDHMVNVAKKVLRHLKNTRVYLVGHSLGGAVLSRLHSFRIKKYFFISPIHPYLVKAKPYKLLKAAFSPRTSLKNVLSSLAFSAAKTIPNLDTFTNIESPWFNIVRQEILQPEFMDLLNTNYQKIKNPTFFVGDDDKVISTRHLQEFVKDTFDQDVTILEGRHNIFDNPELQKMFNEKIAFKKRFLAKWRSIIKK